MAVSPFRFKSLRNCDREWYRDSSAENANEPLVCASMGCILVAIWGMFICLCRCRCPASPIPPHPSRPIVMLVFYRGLSCFASIPSSHTRLILLLYKYISLSGPMGSRHLHFYEDIFSLTNIVEWDLALFTFIYTNNK